MRCLLIALVMGLAACGGGGGGSDTSVPPPPAAVRYDLLYGYFGDCATCVQETKDHTNVQMVVGWGGSLEQHAFEASSAGQKLIVALCWQCGEDNIRWQFTQLRNLNVLQRVVALYPEDEPDVNHIDDGAMKNIVAMVRRVASEFVELEHVKIAVIYGNQGTPGIEAFDWVGADEYGLGLHASKYIKSKMRPDQGLILVPGGADPWKEDPQPFVEYAQADPQVVMIMPFLWRWPTPPGGRGIGDNGMAHAYCVAGSKTIRPDVAPSCP